MSKPIPAYKRKYLIHHRFRFQVIFYFLAFFLVIVTAIYFALDWSFANVLAEVVEIAPGSQTVLQLQYKAQINALGRTIAALTVVGLIFTYAGGLVLTNWAAGPLYRLGRMMRGASEGKIPQRIKVRRQDYFTEICEDFEKLIQSPHFRKDPGLKESTAK